MFSPHKVPLDEIASCFNNYGYELTSAQRDDVCSITIEEALVASLINIKPRLLEGIPILLAKNKIDYKMLRMLIETYGLWNEFGYLGNFSLRHIENQDLRELVGYCQARLKPPTNISGIKGDFFKEFRYDEERNWRVFGAPSYPALEKQFGRYVHG